MTSLPSLNKATSQFILLLASWFSSPFQGIAEGPFPLWPFLGAVCDGRKPNGPKSWISVQTDSMY